MEVLNENDLFETSDLSLVAALLACGARIDAVERNNGPRAVFYLRHDKGLEGLSEAFYAHSLQVDPLQYFNCLKEAKTRLYESPIR